MTRSALAADLAAILDRDLRALRRELEAYPEERQIWQDVPGMPNSAGTLALHLAGNLQHYIGARWAGTGYVRDRDAEFARRAGTRAELVAGIDAAIDAVTRGLAAVDDAVLARPFPEAVGGRRLVTADFLTHLAVHLGYHLGQLDYHRRVVTGSAQGVGALAPAELPEAG